MRRVLLATASRGWNRKLVRISYTHRLDSIGPSTIISVAIIDHLCRCVAILSITTLLVVAGIALSLRLGPIASK